MLSIRLSARRYMIKISTLISGTVAAQALLLIATPIITRLYSPQDFGTVAFALALVSILSTFVACRYEDAILLAEDDLKAIRLLILSVFMVCIVVSLVTVAVGLINYYQLGWLQVGKWALLLPLIIFVTGINNILSAWTLRQDKLLALAFSQVSESLVNLSGRIGAGILYGSSIGGLLVASTAGRATRMVNLGVYSGLPRWADLRSAFDFLQIKQIAREYKDFPLYSAPNGVLKTASQNLPVLLLGILFTPAVVGFYSMANRLIGLPLTVISKGVRRVYFAEAARRNNKSKPLRNVFLKTMLGLFVLALPPLLVVFFWGEPLFAWLLGEKWTITGRYAAILTPWLLTRSVLPLASATFVVRRKQRKWLTINIALSIARVIIFVVAYLLKKDVEQTLIMFTAVNVFLNCLIFLVTYRLSLTSNVEVSPKALG